MIFIKLVDNYGRSIYRLRISVTSNCNLNCTYCHREGNFHNQKDSYLSYDAFQQLYNAASDWLKPILTVAVGTGMRLGEILELEWERIDFAFSAPIRTPFRQQTGHHSAGNPDSIPPQSGHLSDLT